MSVSPYIPEVNAYPQRFDWLPKADPDKAPKIMIREGTLGDMYAVSHILKSIDVKASRKTLSKWFNLNHYALYVAVRNYRHIVGLIVSRHDPVDSRNELLVLWVAPAYRRRKLGTRLLWYATLEQPDYPTVALGNFEDHYEYEGFLRSQGFRRDADYKDDEDPDKSRWVHPAHTRAISG